MKVTRGYGTYYFNAYEGMLTLNQMMWESSRGKVTINDLLRQIDKVRGDLTTLYTDLERSPLDVKTLEDIDEKDEGD